MCIRDRVRTRAGTPLAWTINGLTTTVLHRDGQSVMSFTAIRIVAGLASSPAAPAGPTGPAGPAAPSAPAGPSGPAGPGGPNTDTAPAPTPPPTSPAASATAISVFHLGPLSRRETGPLTSATGPGSLFMRRLPSMKSGRQGPTVILVQAAPRWVVHMSPVMQTGRAGVLRSAAPLAEWALDSRSGAAPRSCTRHTFCPGRCFEIGSY